MKELEYLSEIFVLNVWIPVCMHAKGIVLDDHYFMVIFGLKVEKKVRISSVDKTSKQGKKYQYSDNIVIIILIILLMYLPLGVIWYITSYASEKFFSRFKFRQFRQFEFRQVMSLFVTPANFWEWTIACGSGFPLR